uniref:Uncharacterized protein n=1 Tax=Setaria digitata TaxID=48799 RepID=A0A915PL22_9BILA
MDRFASVIIFWLLYLVQFVKVADIPKPFISTSLACYTYHKINGQITKQFMDECMIGNTCCYSAEFTDKKTGKIIELGGCEDDYRVTVGTHPTLGTMLSDTVNYICEEGTCIERTTNRDAIRLCGCIENNCNMNGIDEIVQHYHERVQKGLIKKPPDYARLLEKTVQILLDG